MLMFVHVEECLFGSYAGMSFTFCAGCTKHIAVEVT